MFQLFTIKELSKKLNKATTNKYTNMDKIMTFSYTLINKKIIDIN